MMTGLGQYAPELVLIAAPPEGNPYLESLLREMQPTTAPVYRTTVGGPRKCEWYEDTMNDPRRTCRFPGVNFLLAVAAGVAVVFALKR